MLKKIYGHNQEEIFPVKPRPPIYLGPPKPNGPIAAPPLPKVSPGVPPADEITPPAPYVVPPDVPERPSMKTSTVWGLIKDCVSGIALSGVTVELDGMKTTTDDKGRYEFKEINPGNYIIYAYKE